MANCSTGAKSDVMSGLALASDIALNTGTPSVILLALSGLVRDALDWAMRILPGNY